MRTKALVLGLVLLMHACGPLSAQALAPKPPDSPGIVQTLVDKAREAKAKVQGFGAAAMGLVGTYYEDHVQPVASGYREWASSMSSSVWDSIQATVGSYSPLRAANATDAQ